MSDAAWEHAARLEWKEATEDLGNGRITAAIRRLQQLYESSSSFSPDLRLDVAFTYGVSLLTRPSMTYDPSRAIEVLQNIIDRKGYGAGHFNEGQARCELGSALSESGQPLRARSELEKGIACLRAQGLSTITARLQLGTTCRSLNLLDEETENLRLALTEAKQRRNFDCYAIACEQLGRTLLGSGRTASAHSWLALAKWFYSQFAPHHLYTMEDVCRVEGAVFPIVLPDPVPEPWEAEWRRDVETAAASARSARLGILDVDLFQMLAACQNTTEGHRVSIPLPLFDEAAVHLLQELISELQAAWLTPDHITTIRDSFLFENTGLSIDQLPRMLPLTDATIRDVRFQHPTGEAFHMWWEAPNVWPRAFGVPLMELAQTYALAYLSTENRAEELKKLAIHAAKQVPTFAGTLPRRLLARWWDLGGMASGQLEASGNLLATLVQPGINNRAVNREKLAAMGFSREEANALDAGGIIGIPYTEVRGWVHNLGGLPINEINVANPPRDYGNMSAAELRFGYLVDTSYQTVFVARALGDQALHGRIQHLYRDHFESFNQSVTPVGSLRLKHFSAPILEVGSVKELQELVELLRSSQGCQEVFFRGQDRNWPLKRTDAVQRLLHGITGLEEPSLLGAATRRGCHYETSHSILSLLAQDLVYKAAIDHKRSLDETYAAWRELRLSPLGEWDVAVMALAQHYGIPTDGIDITSDLEVAVWFAVHDWVDLGNGKATYRPRSRESWPRNHEEWPVVYLIAPVTNSLKPSVRPIEKLARLGLEMVRPMRQQAAFFMGAHSYHRNRLAEAVAAVVRLKPGDWSHSTLTYEWLFPAAEEDPAYRYLLAAKRRWASEPVKDILGHMVEYQ